MVGALVALLIAVAPPVRALGPSSAGPHLGPPVGSRPPAPEQGATWALAKATARRPVEIRGAYGVRGHATGGGPLVIGLGYANRGQWAWVFVTRHSGGSTTTSLVAGPVRHRLQLDLVWDDRGGFHAAPVHIGGRASTIGVLFFVVNGVVDAVDWDVLEESSLEPLHTTVRYGTGTRALLVGAPTGGATATAASVGGGTATFDHRARTGIVGAMEWLSCRACAGTWQSPVGPRHVWESARHDAWAVCWCGAAVMNQTEFAGPPGRWRWTWSGLAAPEPTQSVNDDTGDVVGQPVAGAYAPIGRDWHLFRPCRTSACLDVAVPEPVTLRTGRPRG